MFAVEILLIYKFCMKMILDDEQVRIIKEFEKQGITTNATIVLFLFWLKI